MNVRQLQKILKGKDPEAKIRLAEYDKESGKTIFFNINQACNFEWQKKNNMILLMQGIMDRSRVKNFK